jgi:hypothetical protein
VRSWVNLDTPWLPHWSPIPAIQVLSVTIGYPVQSDRIEDTGNLTLPCRTMKGRAEACAAAAVRRGRRNRIAIGTGDFVSSAVVRGTRKQKQQGKKEENELPGPHVIDILSNHCDLTSPDRQASPRE